MKRWSAAAGLAVLLGAAAWFFLHDARSAPGPATALSPGESPLAALCALRSAFLALPDPVYTGFRHHEAWEESRFGAPRVRHGPFWEITLTDQARRFVHGHSRLELVAALAPYARDPARATRAMALLAGLPVRSRAALHDTNDWARRLAEGPRREPAAAAMPWTEPELDRVATGGIWPYGAAQASDRQDGAGPTPAGTLELALVEVLRSWEALGQDPAGERLEALARRHDRAWLLTAAYPYAEGGFNATQPALARLLALTRGPAPGADLAANAEAMRSLTRAALAACGS
jgi:hypothetical protein